MKRTADAKQRLRRVLPIAGSVALVGWVVWRVSSLGLTRALSQVRWHAMVPLTALVVIALFLWDSLCVRWLFTERGAPISYRTAAEARGTVEPALRRAGFRGELYVADQDAPLPPIELRPRSVQLPLTL